MKHLSYLAMCVGVLLWLQCASDAPGPVEVADVKKNDGTETFILDRTGKAWEVSHARDAYGLIPSQFQFGLGPNAILPIMQPVHISPGEPNYPNDSDGFRVMGTKIGNDARAYRILKMSFNEVVNEQFGNLLVAVAY
jgi:hypothetical protein